MHKPTCHLECPMDHYPFINEGIVVPIKLSKSNGKVISVNYNSDTCINVNCPRITWSPKQWKEANLIKLIGAD